MITNGFTYVAVLVFLAAILVGAEKITKWKFFKFIPPVVLLYLLAMLLCTAGAWDMEATSAAYGAMKNNILYAMLVLMLLRCDIRKILKLGPRMLGGFFAASFSIAIGFIATYAIMNSQLGVDAWKSLGALCGSWMGGSGNLVAVSNALGIGEAELAYALVVDSIDYSIWVMFLLWAISFAPKFNKWTKASTTTLDEVCARLEAEEKEADKHITFPGLLFLVGGALLVSALGQNAGAAINGVAPWLDKATWTVLVVTVVALIAAVTPIGKIAGAAELSNVFLYIVIALLASRASLLELTEAPAWIISGFMILAIHGIILLLLAKLFKLDLFTCGVASLANIGGTASAPILAGAYSGALVPVGVLMALMGYVIGTPVGLLVAKIMQMFA
ncbi:DUF819 family protein [Agathobaculum sp.]|uniref:DUF819 family protein n=1 Tax=Agathobaculum sp. TaxID=2048138 RepID=UPI002A81C198|nr:DUF819 family protein [Agathobaculum sp.]MDY3618602.1 DUF819 family protein [Agathobaculum sp.]